MKIISHLVAFLILVAQPLFAGIPSVEIREALVHEVKETPTGFALIVSGDIRIGKVEGLKADHAVVTQPHGNPAFYIHDRENYEKRLRSYIGKKITVQVWGDILTIESGRVTKIHGGHVSPLHPRKEEKPKLRANGQNSANNEQLSPLKQNNISGQLSRLTQLTPSEQSDLTGKPCLA